ncbi:MAG: HDOD domain-containing protein [Acidobacteria bacterium]|nr:HDOD domain-containing protein [Acidobacteriota bacterium]
MPQNDSLLDRIIQQIDSGNLKMPVYDPVALKLQEAIANKTEDILEIEQLVLSDQVAAAEVLRAANSPFFCGLSPVRTIRNAIVRLGTQQMRRLVILVSERAKYKAHNPDIHRMLLELWRHASTTALASQWLSKRLRSTGIEEICFIGGLLHDIGKLVILRAMDQIKESETNIPAVSQEVLTSVLQTAHCALGYRLLMSWNVPPIYCQIARDHHNEDFLEDLPLAIVRLANAGSRKLGLGLDPNPSMDLSATPEVEMLQIGDKLLSELEAMIEEHLLIAA